MASMAPHLAEVANLVGDLALTNILWALMDNRALTAKELACAARVSPQTTSSHLGKLTDAKLLQVCKQGRYRYYRLASPLVAQMLEAVLVVAADRLPRLRSTRLPTVIAGSIVDGTRCPR
jgi:DNA-binding transcriptional ArsR family regulator